jgi:hypothetical protein
MYPSFNDPVLDDRFPRSGDWNTNMGTNGAGEKEMKGRWDYI